LNRTASCKHVRDFISSYPSMSWDAIHIRSMQKKNKETNKQTNRQCTYNVTSWRVRATVVVVGKR
jgi:hypothetical protein